MWPHFNSSQSKFSGELAGHPSIFHILFFHFQKFMGHFLNYISSLILEFRSTLLFLLLQLPEDHRSQGKQSLTSAIVQRAQEPWELACALLLNFEWSRRKHEATFYGVRLLLHLAGYHLCSQPAALQSFRQKSGDARDWNWHVLYAK